jgi:hypothetical protein
MGRKWQHQDLHAALLEEFGKVRDPFRSKAPGCPQPGGCKLSLSEVAHREGRAHGQGPRRAGNPQNVLDLKVAFDRTQGHGFHRGLFLGTGDLLLPELQAGQLEPARAEQVGFRGAQGPGQGHQHLGSRHHLVPFVLTDGLGRNQVVDLLGQSAQGKTGTRACEGKPSTDHVGISSVVRLTNSQF